MQVALGSDYDHHALMSRIMTRDGCLFWPQVDAPIQAIAAKGSVPASQMAVSPAKDVTLDDKLKALDMLYERQFAEKGQKKNGVEVATFTRK
jgi:hypothetical protein